MANAIDFKEMGLSQLTEKEINKTNGGGFWALFPPALAIALVVSAINNFGDIREGIVDGFNGTPRH